MGFLNIKCTYLFKGTFSTCKANKKVKHGVVSTPNPHACAHWKIMLIDQETSQSSSSIGNPCLLWAIILPTSSWKLDSFTSGAWGIVVTWRTWTPNSQCFPVSSFSPISTVRKQKIIELYSLHSKNPESGKEFGWQTCLESKKLTHESPSVSRVVEPQDITLSNSLIFSVKKERPKVLSDLPK